MNGIVLINKPKGITSRDVVNKVSKKLGIKKIGHTGTLDPLASGVLVLCIGSATKVSELLTSLEKEYIAEVYLGIQTETLDITGNILKEEEVNTSEEEIKEVLSSFIGRYMQEVPIYSAVKVNGKKLYEYARNNEEVELPKKEVEIKQIEMLDNLFLKDNHWCFKFKCLVSKGTYIRSLIRDICDRLGICGTMLNLIRTKQGKFNIDDCISIEDVGEDSIVDIKSYLDLPSVEIDEYLYNKIINGQILENKYGVSKIMFIYNNEVIAIYEEYQKDKKKIKPYCMLGGKI